MPTKKATSKNDIPDSLLPVPSLWTVYGRWHNELPLGPLALPTERRWRQLQCQHQCVWKIHTMESGAPVRRWRRGKMSRIFDGQDDKRCTYDFWTNIENSLIHKPGIYHVAWRNWLGIPKDASVIWGKRYLSVIWHFAIETPSKNQWNNLGMSAN